MKINCSCLNIYYNVIRFVSSETKYYINQGQILFQVLLIIAKTTDLLFIHKRINELIRKQINSTNFKQHNIKTCSIFIKCIIYHVFLRMQIHF